MGGNRSKSIFVLRSAIADVKALSREVIPEGSATANPKLCLGNFGSVQLLTSGIWFGRRMLGGAVKVQSFRCNGHVPDKKRPRFEIL